ncbi:TetR family transcriptional regulator [Sphingobium sp. JS3065]|uniref:TetR/AcrR family transcriptional regulator n=1 Tax=Sphingobium sp. JS3065 TaxID=2970925 RepID=UPI002264C5D5|nr:TetR family transcriptional regulator [Sphingobium sp. JS3065]UZW56425.1 TetR family transcriptional regulator [Sphingobium sp. JS3065]
MMDPEDADITDVLPEIRPNRRLTKQDRSAARQSRITEGAIVAISRYGMGGVTHRRVASEAHVSLAATTYYYETKGDIIADASRTLLARYVDAFRRFASSLGPDAQLSFRDFALKLVFNSAGKHKVETLAWCEILVNAARDESMRELAQVWFTTLDELWQNIASLLGVDDVQSAAVSAIDTVIGLLFIVTPLGLSEEEMRALLLTGSLGSDHPSFHVSESHVDVDVGGKKSDGTRERILNAAAELIVGEGIEALTFRNISERAGLTAAAPTYYFPSISALCNAAQARLFEMTRHRYRGDAGTGDHASLDKDHLIDLLATVFLREATEFRDLSLACYPVYVQAHRDPTLRPGLWALNSENIDRWTKLLTNISPDATAFDRWMLYAAFVGKLIRVLTTAPSTRELSKTRSEFAYEVCALVERRRWSDYRG